MSRPEGTRWHLVDERGRLLGGPKFLDVLLGGGLVVLLLALWQVYHIPITASLSAWLSSPF